MKNFINTKNEKLPFDGVKKTLVKIQHQADDTEFHCPQHNNSCSKDYTCSDYLRYSNATTLATIF